MNLPAGDAGHVHLLAGPSFNLKLDETFDPDLGNGESGISGFETTFVLGGGVTVHRFRVDVRYGMGLTSFLDEDEDGLTAKNRVFSVLAGFELR